MISAILLAAGQSKRMGAENKLTKKFKGTPLIKHAIKNILASSIDELIIVLGYKKTVIKKLINKDKNIRFAFNKDFKSGMASSIKTGLVHLSKKTDFFFICHGDMPMISKNIYNELMKKKNHRKIIIPIYKGKRGHPVLFPISLKEKIMSIEGDIGAKNIIEINYDNILNVQVNNKNITKDFNTKESFSS
jgi:molybdenum cofactor cytidylyltransferase